MKPINFIFMFILMLVGIEPGMALADRMTSSRGTNENTIRTGNAGTLGGGRTNGTVRSSDVARYSTASAQNGSQTIGRVARSAARSVTNGVNANVLTPIVRTAQNIGRSGRNASRAASTSVSRATAVFSDISKIGGGYATCRDAYATCMDQFCANANDTYRRCFCSDKFSDFRDAEDRLDKAVTLLAQFEDNSLNAVDKTAAEVAAMYSASEGEAAIKKDTSAAAKMLDQIGDLLAGKSIEEDKGFSYNNIKLIDVNFSSGLDDIWSGGSESSIFGGGNNVDLSALEGVDLYNSVNDQCMEMVADVCNGSAVANMAKSSYNIMITQDCNAYAKKVDAKTEQVKQTVRTAEKYLREARLEEYRSHNSDDMNKCITAVRTAIQSDVACGENYIHCLDYTGRYLDVTGEPIRYNRDLFKLTESIKLENITDPKGVLSLNKPFNTFLEGKRAFAAKALDSCRDIADSVWEEFKRSAIIEIAQAQDEKLEEVKMSCVSTVAECYDAQTNVLKGFGGSSVDTTAGAIATARGMCADRLIACAALFDGDGGCVIDERTGKVTDATNKKCGLDALLNFVEGVGDARINQACDTALKNKLHELCTPDSGTYGYPYKCRTTKWTTIEETLKSYAETACFAGGNSATSHSDTVIENLETELNEEMDVMLAGVCESLNGIWDSTGPSTKPEGALDAFYSVVSGGNNISWGKCNIKDEESACKKLGAYATYDPDKNICSLTDNWYKDKCKNALDGYWYDSQCFVKGE